MLVENFVEGWTERITETVKTAPDESSPLSDQNLGGLTVEIVLRDCNGTIIPVPGQSGKVTETGAEVYFDPEPGDLKASRAPYSVRWKITDGSNRVAFWPNLAASPVKWEVGL